MSESDRMSEVRPNNRDLAIVVVVCLIMLAAVVAYLITSNNVSEIREQTSIAREAFTSGDLDGALEAAEAAVDAGADNAATLNLLGEVREAKGELEGAEQAFAQSLALNPNQPRVLHELATIAYARGDLEMAEADLEKALEGDDDLAGSRVLLADVLVKQGRTDEARVHYETVLRASPQGINLSAVRAKLDALPQ